MAAVGAHRRQTGTLAYVSEQRAGGQRGFTLIEATIAAGVSAVVLLAALGALRSVAKYGTHRAPPLRSAALALAEQVVRSAEDRWKYGGGSDPSGTWTTTLPLARPNAAPTSVPATVSAALTTIATPNPDDPTAEQAHLTVTVRYPPDLARNDPGLLQVDATLHVKAPLPGSTVAPPGMVDAPSGAP